MPKVNLGKEGSSKQLARAELYLKRLLNSKVTDTKTSKEVRELQLWKKRDRGVVARGAGTWSQQSLRGRCSQAPAQTRLCRLAALPLPLSRCLPLQVVEEYQDKSVLERLVSEWLQDNGGGAQPRIMGVHIDRAVCHGGARSAGSRSPEQLALRTQSVPRA